MNVLDIVPVVISLTIASLLAPFVYKFSRFIIDEYSDIFTEIREGFSK